MAIYEFECKKCSKVTEEMIDIKEDIEWIVCECGYVANKILSAGTFNVRGYSYKNGYSKEDK